MESLINTSSLTITHVVFKVSSLNLKDGIHFIYNQTTPLIVKLGWCAFYLNHTSFKHYAKLQIIDILLIIFPNENIEFFFFF
jgi:hypothetical protein